jgi:hypothetical protein
MMYDKVQKVKPAAALPPLRIPTGFSRRVFASLRLCVKTGFGKLLLAGGGFV